MQAQELFDRQQAIISEIERISVNFDKDSATRKTAEYIQRRLTTLDSLWGEFQQNDTQLAQYREDHKEREYFTKNIIQRLKKFYQEVRLKISTFVPHSKSPGQQAPEPKPSTSGAEFNIPALTTVDEPCGPVDEMLKQQRTNFRALQRQTESLDIDSIEEKWEIEDELKNLQQRWRVIDELHLRIDNLLQGADGFYDGEFIRYESMYKDIKRKLNRKLCSSAHLQQSTPKIEIPIFTGQYTQWPTFCDLFSEAIHNNKFITKAQKMQHLKSKLKGEAERLIQHLNISADNYDTAWDILSHRYNNPNVLFSKQIEIFLNQPSIHKQSSFELKRIYDTTMESIHAIHNLGVDTTSWDPLLVHLLTKKLDAETYTNYKESRKAPRSLPSFDELMTFIESKFIALEPIHKREKEAVTSYKPPTSTNQYQKPVFKHNNNQGNFPSRNYHSVATYSHKCPFCNLDHDLFVCRKFHNLPTESKMPTISKLKVCPNCLYRHYDNKCISTKKCKECNGNHNTKIHEAAVQCPTNNAMTNAQPGPSTSSSSVIENKDQHKSYHVSADDEEVLLTTVSLKVKSSDGTHITLRALLDQGSQISLISENAAQRLSLQRKSYPATVSGIGSSSKQSRGAITLECQSIYNDYQFTTQALVLSRVISNLPMSSLEKTSWPHLQHIPLADPDYNVSKPIDLLLDASVYSEIIMNGLIKGPPQAPIAQQTRLGWILSGNVKTFQCNAVINNLHDLAKYWEVEDIRETSVLSEEDQYCEDLYQTTTSRLENGRYQVALPMKPDFEQHLGSSRSKAVAQFIKVEERLHRSSSLSESYHKFMNEYEQLGHMISVSNIREPTCYLPHHGVMKLDSTTTSLRVVFNASSKTSSGRSLNDLMLRGPNLQKDLMTLILKWRQYKYVITADIEKMFRQIIIRECDQSLQKIIWRESPRELLKEYQLTTVTYGTKAAPFLAMRTLKQISSDYAEKYPLAASALESSFYMDDLMSGHKNSISAAREIQQQLIFVLREAGMNLRKWSANVPELVKDLSSDQLDSPLDFKCTESRKTLGLRWNPSSDSFTFQNKIEDGNKPFTKRLVLSDISKIFDPMGWLSPLTIRAKLLFQRVWTSGISWDEELSPEMQSEWRDMRNDLKNMENFSIPRYLGQMQQYEVHAYCDSSEKAYASCIYFVSIDDKGARTSRLVVAKTKVAPRSKQISLPRLELLGALLLSKLMKKVLETISSADIKMYAWTDSMVVLGWLYGDITRWKQFVANRVRQITNIIPSSSWHHVKSESNPADCATRGMRSSVLSSHELWWKGPEWLTNFNSNDLKPITYQNPKMEEKKAAVNTALVKQNNSTLVNELLANKSSISRIIKTMSWVLRFVACLRSQGTECATLLLSAEMNNAYNYIIKAVQVREFESDLTYIKTKGHVHKNSKIASLNPFVDQQGILRVGGRLTNADVTYSAKHPVLLTSDCRLTELIIHHAHLATMHGGPRLTLNHIRERFWIISGIRTVKKQLRLCVKCRRYSQDKLQQIMADLPHSRVTPSRPFTNTGVDFTGHVELKINKGRGIKTTKGYVAVFVCLSTKAIHLELVSDMSTPTFLSAFRRMCARRGTPLNMFSDNGTTFVGCSRVLQEEYKQILESINPIVSDITEMGITWHFNAPVWPSAGGLWESAVKSFKYHLKRVLGEQRLTYEEFTTLLCQIEACLNSRPLCQLIKEDNLPPGKWAIARVQELHPGQDGFVRVVSLKTQNSTLKRPITKLILLPVHDNVPGGKDPGNKNK